MLTEVKMEVDQVKAGARGLGDREQVVTRVKIMEEA